MPDPTERLTRAKRVLISPSEEADLGYLVAELADSFGTTVTLSHLQRALLRLLQHASPHILSLASKSELRRPPNSEAEARDEFEHALAHLLHVAFKKSEHMV